MPVEAIDSFVVFGFGEDDIEIATIRPAIKITPISPITAPHPQRLYFAFTSITQTPSKISLTIPLFHRCHKHNRHNFAR